MNQPDTFIFKSYNFDPNSSKVTLNYSFSDGQEFIETYTFNCKFADYDHAQLDKAVRNLWLMAGVSYFKAYAPSKLLVEKTALSSKEASFFSKTYQKGLGEFWYVNNLDPRTRVVFPAGQQNDHSIEDGEHRGLLIGIGGGKDSLVTLEALKTAGKEVTTWSLNHRKQLEPLVGVMGADHVFIERAIDSRLLELNKSGVYNGHVPISAILACVGTVLAVLCGKKDIVVSNEQTANEPTLSYQGVSINHQYSKSQEFEQDYQAMLKAWFGDSIRYYSFLRPLTELRIAEIFATTRLLEKYQAVFSSCNRAFTLDSDHLYWCGECPKCAFTFLILTPFVEKLELESLWGKNLLLDPKLVTTYKNLLGISGNKPLDCVGEIKESRAAMKLCFKVYPELESQYEFELPEDYDYRSLGSNEMPEDIQKTFDSFISAFETREQPE